MLTAARGTWTHPRLMTSSEWMFEAAALVAVGRSHPGETVVQAAVAVATSRSRLEILMRFVDFVILQICYLQHLLSLLDAELQMLLHSNKRLNFLIKLILVIYQAIRVPWYLLWYIFNEVRYFFGPETSWTFFICNRRCCDQRYEAPQPRTGHTYAKKRR